MSGQPGHARASVVRRSGVRVAWQAIPRECARRDLADALVASLAGSHGDSITVGRRCERCGASNHGRPFVVGAAVHASISYAGDLVVVAVADSRRVLALGIDAERVSRVRHDLRGVITPGRGASLRRWTRVEAVLKADGRGLSIEPDRVRIERSIRGVHGSIAGEGTGSTAGALDIRPRLLRVRGPRGVVISLAVASV